MTLQTYTRAADFLADAQQTLERAEELNSLQLGVALSQAAQPTPPSATPWFAVVRRDGGIAATAMMTPPYKLTVASPHDDVRPLLAPAVEYLVAHHYSVPGVTGRTPVAQACAELYAAATSCTVVQGARMRLYTLRTVIPPATPSDGVFRVATEDDTDLLSAWSEAFLRETSHNDVIVDLRALTAAKIAEGSLFVWDSGSGPVSMAARARPTRTCASINFVYTPPEHRRHGYAGATTAALSQRLLDAGYRTCALFTDLANPTSNHIYQAIGYRPVCDFAEYHFLPSGAENRQHSV